jgi:hypothetical protein
LDAAPERGMVRLGESSATLVEAISERERELNEITQRLFTSQPNSVSSELVRIRQFVFRRLENIRELLSADVGKAKLELSKHVLEIRMIPQVVGKKGHYVASGEWNLLGGYAGDGVGSLNIPEKRVPLVAGGCNVLGKSLSFMV